MIATQRVSIIVTKRCTLSCKLCGALAPYVKQYHPTFDFIKREIDAFFSVATTGIVDISGGEPFLRGTASDFMLGDLLLYLSDNCIDKFERLRIFTNATIVPSDELCEVFRKVMLTSQFSITIDHYGEHSPKVGEVAAKLSDYGVPHEVRDYSDNIHCDGWVDLRDISYKHDLSVAKKIYSKCAIPQKLGCCLELLNGIVSPCSVVASRYLCGDIDKNSDDIVDIFADKATVKDKLEKILCAACFDSCRYCNGGMSDTSPRFVPAEQATSGDVAEWRTKHAMRL